MSGVACSASRGAALGLGVSANFPLTRGIDSLIEDPKFDAVKECYYDISQYAWVEKDYCTDFGKYIYQKPRGVFKPSSTEALQEFIELANAHEVRISVRGQGHSTCGQTLCENSIVVDLKECPKEFKFPNPDKKDHLTVPANATWKEVLDFSFQHQLTVPVLPDYLPLSVGGILNTGGLGGSSYRKGPLAAQVVALDILTLDGKIQSCSKTENPELFHVALCSLGQLGIILNATLSLTDKKEYVHCQRLYYRSAEQFLKNQNRFYSQGKVDHLKGFIQKQDGEWLYAIEAAVFHNGQLDEVQDVFEGFSPDEIEKKDNSYSDFVNEVAGLVDRLSKENKWDVPHPWYEVLLPEDQIAEHLKLALESPFLTGSEPILAYPINVEQSELPLFIHPQGGTKKVYLLSLLYNCTLAANPHLDSSKVIAYNRFLYEDAVKRGGRYYPPRALPSLHDWKLHFGSKWPLFCEAKAKYDPHNIRALILMG